MRQSTGGMSSARGRKGSLCAACRQGVLQMAPKVRCRGLNAHGASSFAMRDSCQGEGKEVGCLRGPAVHKRVGEVRQSEVMTRETEQGSARGRSDRDCTTQNRIAGE